MGFLRVQSFLCWDLKTASVVFAVYEATSAFMAALLLVLDLLDVILGGFSLPGRFKTEWRMHVWREFVACNTVLLVAHSITAGLSLRLTYALFKFEYQKMWVREKLLRIWLIWMCIYYFGDWIIALYEYTWMGQNQFMLPYNAFEFIFWLMRIVFNVCAMIVMYSFLRNETDEKDANYGLEPPAYYGQYGETDIPGAVDTLHRYPPPAAHYTGSQEFLMKNQQYPMSTPPL